MSTAQDLQKGGQGTSFALITALFFLWGFVTALNDVLVPYLKKYFDLSFLQAAMVQMVFFGAYFIGSLCYYLLSKRSIDIVARIGYKRSMSIGLLIAFTGTFLFIPAAGLESFPLFLSGLFVLGLGFTLLQVAANPYVVLLGPAPNAATRLNFAQGVNSLGTTIAPLLGALILFGRAARADDTLDIAVIEKMYLSLSVVLLLMAVLVWIAPLPEKRHEESEVTEGSVLRFPHLVMGVFAIFAYVGAEVSTGTFLISYMRLPAVGGLAEVEASRFVSMYWGGLMIGRFIGAASFSTALSTAKKQLIIVGLPLIVIAALWFFTDRSTALYAAIFLVLNVIAFLAGRFMPARTIAFFASLCGVFLVVSSFSSREWAGWLLVGTGLFNSIMWSVIFSLALDGLGKYTSQGSSLLVMAILGAACIPPLQGAIADKIGLQQSLWLPACCYVYLTYYGIKGYAKRKKPIIVHNALS